MAAVAISVAMVIPEIGFAELPISPTIRELTVTNRNPNTHHQQRSGQVRLPAGKRARDGLELKKDKHARHQQNGADTTTPIDKSSSVRIGRAAAPATLRKVLKA